MLYAHYSLAMSLLVRVGIAEKVAKDAPREIKELIDRLADSEDDVVVRRPTIRDPAVYIKGRLIGAWLEL